MINKTEQIKRKLNEEVGVTITSLYPSQRRILESFAKHIFIILLDNISLLKYLSSNFAYRLSL